MTQPTFALRVERLLDAPRNTVFDAWIDAEHLWKWYHFNDDWKIVDVESDVRQAASSVSPGKPPTEYCGLSWASTAR